MNAALLNGMELEYDITGSGEPVVLISPVLADGFAPLTAEASLNQRYQLITYHKRGWVGSTHAAGPVSMADHAADAVALLNHLGLAQAHIAGHSSGAAVAAQLAQDAPERVTTLTLLELTILSVPSGEAFLQEVGPAFEAYSSGAHERALGLFMSVVSGMDWERCRALLDERIPGSVAQTLKDADTFFGIELPALGEWQFSAEQATAIHQPVLSVFGGNTEKLWVEVAQFLRTALPHAEEQTVEGVGHLLHIERSEPVARAMTEFLQRHPISP